MASGPTDWFQLIWSHYVIGNEDFNDMCFDVSMRSPIRKIQTQRKRDKNRCISPIHMPSLDVLSSAFPQESCIYQCSKHIHIIEIHFIGTATIVARMAHYKWGNPEEAKWIIHQQLWRKQNKVQ